jgi:uncharacterized membrane protein YbhN (UPF0104 family)
MAFRIPGRPFWIKALKITIICAVVVLIWRLGIINATTISRIFSQPLAAILAVLALAIGIQLSVVRWYILLKVHGQAVPLGRLTNIVFTSYFLGSTTFGTLGVDALRLYYIGQERHDSVGQAYLSIAADRLIGLFGLIAAGGVFFAWDYNELLRHGEMRYLAVLSLLIGVGVILVAILVATFDRFVAPILQKLRPFVRLRTHFNLLMHYYSNAPGSIGLCIVVSIVIQFFNLASLLILAEAILNPTLSFSQLGLAGVMTTIANQVPFTAGGIAIGETLFSYLCRLMDPVNVTSDYGSVVFLQRLAALVAVSPGLFLFMFGGKRRPDIR